MSFAICRAVGLAFVLASVLLAEEVFPVRRATLWGGAERDGLHACAIDANGVALLVGSTRDHQPPPGTLVRALEGAGSGTAGCILRYHLRTGEIIEVVTAGSEWRGIKLDRAGNCYLFSPYDKGNVIIKTDPDLRTVLWTYSSGAGHDFEVGPEGDLWVLRKSTITHVAPDGSVAGSFSTQGGAAGIALDPVNQRILCCGYQAQTNLFWPWVIAYDLSGQKVYEMWNWTPKDAWKGGSADSFVNRIRVIGDKLYLIGTSDGNPTTLESSSRQAGAPYPPAVSGGTPFPSADPASSREVGWFGTADVKTGDMLKVRRLFAPALLRRPSKEDPGRRKMQAGTTKITDITADEKGNLYLVGFARGKLPWTVDSKHRTLGPDTWQGKWGNSEVPRDPFLIVLSPEQDRLLYCGSFAQGSSDAYEGAFTGVAVRGGAVVCSGWVTKPGSPLEDGQAARNRKNPQWREGPPEEQLANPPDLAPPAVVYLQDAFQSAWGGLTDGYAVVLGAAPTTDAHQALLARLDLLGAAVQSDLADLRNASDGYAPALQKIEARIAAAAEADRARLPLLTQAVEVVGRSGVQALDRAKQSETADPRRTKDLYAEVAKRWATLPPGTAAAARLAELPKDAAFKRALVAQGLWKDIESALAGLKEAEPGQQRSAFDPAFQRVNATALQRIQRAAAELAKRDAGSVFADLAGAAASGLDLPMTPAAEANARAYGNLLAIEKQLRPVPGAKATAKDPAYAKVNGEALRALLVAGQAIAPANDPAAVHARALLQRYQLID